MTKRLLLLAICVFVMILILILYAVMPFSPKGKPLLIAYHVFPDGSEACVTQRYGGLLELYEVSFYYRHEGVPSWTWYYIDHEDLYWHSGDIVYDDESNSAVIMHRGRKIATFKRDKQVLYLAGKNYTSGGHTITGTPLLDPSR